MLHILSCSPWQCDIANLLRMLRVEDDILLFQDGVFAAISNSYFAKILIDNISHISVLREDVEARGLLNQIAIEINIICYLDFVNLVIKQNNCISW